MNNTTILYTMIVIVLIQVLNKFPTAAARQFFEGDCDKADLKNFPG